MEWKSQIMLFENRFVFGLGLECDRLRKKYCRICLVNQYVVVVEWGTAESAFLWLAVVDYFGSVGDDERIIVVLWLLLTDVFSLVQNAYNDALLVRIRSVRQSDNILKVAFI